MNNIYFSYTVIVFMSYSIKNDYCKELIFLICGVTLGPGRADINFWMK